MKEIPHETRKRGRPFTTGISPRWTFRLDPETRRLLDLLADAQMRSRASIIKVLIHDAAKPLIAAQAAPIPQAKTARAKRIKQHAAPARVN